MGGVDVSSGAFAPGYRAPFAAGGGDSTSSLFAPASSSLFALHARLAPGATVEWGTDHGDEAVYVIDGAIRVDDTVLDAGGAVIVEAGVGAALEAVSDATCLHVGSQSGRAVSGGPFGAPEPGRRLHTIPAAEADHRPATTHPLDVRFFADSGCPTCRISLFTVAHTDGWKAGAHQHTQDEIITVLHGDFMVGPNRVPPGRSVAVPAGTYYGYHALGAYRFVNYRADASYVAFHGQEPRMESGPLRS